MKVIWEKLIFNCSCPFHHECKPFIVGDKVFHAFWSQDFENPKKNWDKIYVCEFNKKNGDFRVKDFTFKKDELTKYNLIHTEYWRFILKQNKLFLDIGTLFEVGSNEIKMVGDKLQKQPDKEGPKSEYNFKNKLIKYNQLQTFECLDKMTNKALWKVTIKGYLYTPIELKKNHLIFGTAGKGGGLYSIHLESGKIVSEFINGDASNYEWFGDKIIIKDLKGNLQIVDPYKNKVIELVPLKEKMTYSSVTVDKKTIFTTLFNMKKNYVKFVCIK